MDDAPNFMPAEQIWALRGGRAAAARFSGLYARGNVDALACPTVAIVGSRAASEYGRRIAWRFAAELGRAGVCVISGLALGIDGAAHAGSLSAGAATIGILGGGHDRFFPRRNRALAREIVEKGGAVLSPYPPEAPALPRQFLERNGVIAALSDAVVVIEAAARSGALNTASWAAASNVPVLAVPGDIDHPKVAGCHALVRDGAVLARNAGDVLEAIGVSRAATAAHAQQVLPLIDGLQGRIVAALREDPLHIDELATKYDATVPEILTALAHLSIAGFVYEHSTGVYACSSLNNPIN